MSGAQIPSVGGVSSDALSLPVTTPAASHDAAGGFSGEEPDLVARWPNIPASRRATLARVEHLYMLGRSMPQVAEIMGLSAKQLDNIRSVWRITSTPAARRRAQEEARKATTIRFRQRRERAAEQLRALIARNRCTVMDAARGLGIPEGRAKDLAKEFRIKAAFGAVDRARQAACIKGAEQSRLSRAAKQPTYRSEAQRENITRSGAMMWAAHRPTKAVVVPPPANADELIREAIAAGKVTVCPPRFAAPVNNGRGL